MLKEAIELCPEDPSEDTTHTNAFQPVAHHTPFMTHMNLIEDDAD